MSTYANEEPTGLDDYVQRATLAENARKPFEIAWQMAQAFVQGRQWVGWDRSDKRVVEIPNPQNRVRHTVNVLTGYFWTQQGKLVADDIRPDVTFRREDVEGQSYARAARRAFELAWEDELEAKTAYTRASIKRLTYGLGGLQVRFDPSYGASELRMPTDASGRPVLDEQRLAHLEQHGVLPDGSLPGYKHAQEGRVCWYPFGPFETLPPPGVEHESLFPWLIIGRPVWLPLLKELYPNAKDLTAEKIRVSDTMGLTGGDQPTPNAGVELKDHVMLYTCFDFPTPKQPQGKQTVWAAKTQLNDEKEKLPVQVKGRGYAGLVFLKYHVIDRRFWPVGLVEPLIGPQRQRNVSRSQNIEIKDRLGLGRVYAHENAYVETQHPEGLPAELVVIRAGYEYPKETQGTGPGPWLREEADMNDNDMRQVAGLGDISLSQVPTGVSAYSAFALLVEQDDRRIGPVRADDRERIAELVKMTFPLIKQHWPEQKTLDLEGEDGLMDALIFNASRLPDSVYIKVPTSAPLPQGQAAQAQLIMDVFNAGIASGQALPLDWLYDSFTQGRMQPLPKRELKVQEQAADYENMLMAHGTQVQVREYDNDELHVQRHRAAQSAYQVVAPAMPQFGHVVELLEQHVQEHLANAQQKAQLAVQSQPNGIQQAPSQGVGGQNAGLGPLAAATGQPTGRAA